MDVEKEGLPEQVQQDSVLYSYLPTMLISKYTTILEANEAIITLLGYSKKDLLHSSLLDITDVKDRAREVNNFIDLFYGSQKQSGMVKSYLSANSEAVCVFQFTSLVPSNDRKEANYSLVHLIPMKGNHRAIMAHLDDLSGHSASRGPGIVGNVESPSYFQEIRKEFHMVLGKGLTECE